MSSRLAFTGSKRAARQLAAAAREVARVDRELNGIAQLAPDIRDDAHLQQILTDVEDPDMRVAVESLLKHFIHAVETDPKPPC